MYYLEYGKSNKEIIIFIHGAMWPRSFNKQLILKKDYHCIVAQMDGHGKEYDSKFSREKVVDELISYIEKLEVEKVHLAGFSLGTQIVLMLINKRPDLIDKVVLVSPLLDADSIDIFRIKFGMEALARLAKVKPIFNIMASILEIEKQTQEEALLEMKNQKVGKLAKEIMEENLTMKDLSNLNKFKNPVYIASGLKDMPCFIQSAKNLKDEFSDSVLESFPKSSHIVMITDCAKLNESLINFFKNGNK